jgi:hypothetical protein
MMDIQAMMTAWDAEFGRAAWLPVLIGPKNAVSRAVILSALTGADVPSRYAGINQFRAQVGAAFGVNFDQCQAAVDQAILDACHAYWKSPKL